MLRKLPSYLLLFLNATLLVVVLFHDRLQLPMVLQLSGRWHPLLLHLPIGFLIFALAIRRMNLHPEPGDAKVFFDRIFFWTALATVASALTGCFLGKEEGYSGTTLYRHMNLGTTLSILTLLLSMFQEKRKAFNILGVGAIIIVALTGHYGAILTHGEDFLSGPRTEVLENSQTLQDTSSVFTAAVQPLLQKKCVACHNPGKRKGGLDMTTWNTILSGGEHGSVIEPGKPAESILIQRIMLPAEHDDHMPPAGKQQLTAAEIELFRHFIKSGATKELKLGDENSGDSLQTLAWQIAGSFNKSEIITGKTIEPVAPETIEKLNTVYRNVSILAANDFGVRVAFYLPAGFTSEALTDLDEIAKSIVELNLSGMPITENDLQQIRNFKNLKILNLNNTNLDNNGLKLLKDLSDLTKLSVSNSKVTASGLRDIASEKSLKEVYAWNIASEETDLSTLMNDFSNINWVFGEQLSEDEILQLTPPMLLNESRILKAGELISFKHNFPGVTIRYTTDAQILPDSINGIIYKGPVKPNLFTVIKARTIKTGWRMSQIADATFFTEGIHPDKASLLTASASEYRANGIATLTDSRAGDQDNHRDGQWLGYRENSLIASFEFEENKIPQSVTVSYLKNTGAYIMPPQKIKIFAGNSRNEMKLITERIPTQPASYDKTQVLGESIQLNGAYRFIKIEIQPLNKMPQWHGGKGQRGWVFADEIFFYPAPTI